jgi:hypothetical protein
LDDSAEFELHLEKMENEKLRSKLELFADKSKKDLLMDFCNEFKSYFHSILALNEMTNYEVFIDLYLKP